jgi:hypothetical protein
MCTDSLVLVPKLSFYNYYYYHYYYRSGLPLVPVILLDILQLAAPPRTQIAPASCPRAPHQAACLTACAATPRAYKRLGNALQELVFNG